MTASLPAGSLRGSGLSGAQKCAILCMTFGAEASAKVLQQLSPAEMERVSRGIAQMPGVRPETVESILHEYTEVGRAVHQLAQGGVDYAREILEQAVGPQKARSLLDRIDAQPVETSLTRFKRAAPEVLHSALRGEHPQTIALVLAHLDPSLAASVIEIMGDERAGDVLCRMARMEKVAPEMLQLVEAGLSGRSDLALTQEMTASGGPAAVARLLNLTSGSAEKAMLEAITARNSAVADEIRNLMFVFEDLRLLDSRSMQRLLRDVDGKELALALKAASEELKAHILKNMSERGAAALQEEIEMLGPVRVKDVEAAHGNIVKTVRSLQEQGEVVVERSKEDALIA
ncbi:MAG: flagellar motor switch protein FliG [Gemmatimonadales bacterium]|nr:flagellar motor switch protein FliG [Gemmatimonadales bacterium]